MTEQSPAGESAGARSWSQVPELKDSELDKLINELMPLEKAQEQIQQRMAAIRGLISELISPLSFSVRAQGRVLRWVKGADSEQPSEKPDVTKVLRLAISLGATPDQTKACMVPVEPKKPHLRIDKVKDGEGRWPADEQDVREILEETVPASLLPSVLPSAPPS